MAKPKRLLVTPSAAADLNRIYDPLFSAMQKRIELLRFFPEMGRALEEDFHGWRVTPVGVFRIFYRVTRRGVEIGYVRHAKRQPPQIR